MNYSLRKLQMAYMVVTMKEVENTDNKCLFCWEDNCGCEHKETVKDNLFLNFSDDLEYVEIGQTNIAI